MTNMDMAAMRDAAERFLSKRHPLDIARQANEGGGALWGDIAEQGWPAMLVPESQGGLGLGMREAVVIAQAAGKHLVSVPLVANMVVLPTLCDQHTEAQEALATMLSGGQCHAWADEDGVGGAWIEGADSLRTVWRLRGLDLQQFDAQPGALGLDATQRVGQLNDNQPRAQWRTEQEAADLVVKRLRLLRAAELTGAATAALDLAVTYAREREQFGKPIGVNQAVKHRLADSWMALDEAMLTIDAAAAAFDAGAADASIQLDMAQWLAVDSGRAAVQQAVQTHGALGITWECGVHLYLKRVLRLAAILTAQCSQADLLERVWQR